MRVVAAVIAVAALPCFAQQPTPAPGRDTAVYVPKQEDPVLKDMEAKAEAAAAQAEEATAAVREAQKARREQKKKEAKELRFDVSGISRPASPQAFSPAFHFPPVAQYMTGTCWSFSTTSFYESEIHRLHSRAVKLSEIWTVYWEYVEKMKGFVRARGDQPIAEGSESNAVPRIWKLYGVVPAEAYPGVTAADGRHDHSALIAELQTLGGWVEAHGFWHEEEVAAMTRVILDRHLGRPPENFEYQSTAMTPHRFLAEVVALDLDDYVELMSTLSIPFYTQGEYDVPDNWWHDASYHNVPLEEWYAALTSAVERGYTVAIGGDVSEPGIWGEHDIAVVPSYDIPQDHIDQHAREFRFFNHTSEDDHGIHLVGMASTADGHTWFLIKDSGRSSRRGAFEGYYFFRDDFVRLKMLTYTVHRAAVAELLAKFFPQT